MLFFYEVFLFYFFEIRGKGIVYCISWGVKNFNFIEGEYLFVY